MLIWVVATRLLANELNGAIDTARGPTEDVRERGTLRTVARKTWCRPLRTDAGLFAIPVKPNAMRPIEGRVVGLVTIPLIATAIEADPDTLTVAS